MTNQFQSFQRKSFPVQAAQVTPLNIEELAKACGGKIMHDGAKEGQLSRDYIKVRVAFPLNEEQTRAHVGDWLVKQRNTYKVYKDPAFRKTFEKPDGSAVPREQQPKRKNNGPSPAQMPKKIAEPSIADEQKAAAEAYVAQENANIEITSETVEVPVINPDPTPEVIQEAVKQMDTADFREFPSHVVEETPGVVTEDKSGDGVESVPAEMEPAGNTSVEPDEASVVDEEPKKTPITLDELNEMPGDPRSAQEIMSEK